MHWYTGFNADYLLPAMIEAGWPVGLQRRRPSVGTPQRAPTSGSPSSGATLCSRGTTSVTDSLASVSTKKMRKGRLMAIGGWANIGTV
jgi:hypothetical protein